VVFDILWLFCAIGLVLDCSAKIVSASKKMIRGRYYFMPENVKKINNLNKRYPKKGVKFLIIFTQKIRRARRRKKPQCNQQDKLDAF
jgi:hypothetical protein